jgi:hypothetical protein
MLVFWGAFRLGEILTEKEISFDRFSKLLRKDVRIERDHLTLKVKPQKTEAGLRQGLCALTKRILSSPGFSAFKNNKQVGIQKRNVGKTGFLFKRGRKPHKVSFHGNFKGLLLRRTFQNLKISRKVPGLAKCQDSKIFLKPSMSSMQKFRQMERKLLSALHEK